MRYFPFCHILLELSCKTQKAPHQICVFSPQFGGGHRHCFLTKQFSQPSALNVRFHAVATAVGTRPLPPMPLPITNLMRNQVAHYHCTTGTYVRFGSKADMCNAKRDVRFIPNSNRESEIPQKAMSALAPKADMCSALVHVRFGPIADKKEVANRGDLEKKRLRLSRQTLNDEGTRLCGFVSY